MQLLIGHLKGFVFDDGTDGAYGGVVFSAGAEDSFLL